MKISAAVRVDVGKVRKNNEDNVYFNGLFLNEENREQPLSSALSETTGDRFIFAVSDGMGGENAGEAASYIAVTTMDEWWKGYTGASAEQWESTVRGYCDTASKSIYEMSLERFGRSGCTCAMVVLENEALNYANMGDSRIYLLRKGKLKQLSEDHTLAGMLLAAGTLTPEQARVSPAKNKLTQYLGSNEQYMVPKNAYGVPLQAGDKLLLCSDGLTDMLTDADITKILMSSPDSDTAAEQLKATALENGGKDNCSVIVITVEQCESKAAAGSEGKRNYLRTTLIILAATLLLAILLACLFAYYEYGDGASIPQVVESWTDALKNKAAAIICSRFAL